MIDRIMDWVVVKVLVYIMVIFVGILMLPYLLWKAGIRIRARKKI